MYVRLQPIAHALAEGIYNSIDEAFCDIGVPDWQSKVVGFGCDGAAVNLGLTNSVLSRLQSIHPHIVAIHCVSHRLELGAADAARNKANPDLGDIRQVLVLLYKHYHKCPKAMRDLKAIAEAMGDKSFRPANLKGTRWTPRYKNALTVFLKGFSSIRSHFEHTVAARIGTAEVTGHAKNILRTMRNFGKMAWAHFMLDVLTILSQLSLTFQEDKTTISDALDALSTATLSLVAMNSRPGAHLQQYLAEVDEVGMYRGHQMQGHCHEWHAASTAKIGTTIRSIIDHVCGRLQNIETNPEMATLRIITTPSEWPLTDAELSTHREQEIALICDTFAPLLEKVSCDTDQIKNQEWSAFKVYANCHRDIATTDLLQ